MNSRALLVFVAVVEATAGVALLFVPAKAVSLLLGATLDTQATQTLARATGCALLAIGLACWGARGEGASPAGRAVVVAVLFYNAAVAALLAYAGAVAGLEAPLLWPCVPLHVAIAIWCGLCLRERS